MGVNFLAEGDWEWGGTTVFDTNHGRNVTATPSGGIQWGGIVNVIFTPGPCLLIFDTFTDPDGTHLTAHAIAPTDTPGTTWAYTVGTWSIVGNHAVWTAPGGTVESACVVEPGVAEYTVSADITRGPSGAGYFGLVVNYLNITNYWRIYFDSGFNVLFIASTIAGSFTFRAVCSYTWAFGATHNLKAAVAGDTITLYIDGALCCTFTLSGRPLKAIQPCGLWAWYLDGTATYDNFKVTTP